MTAEDAETESSWFQTALSKYKTNTQQWLQELPLRLDPRRREAETIGNFVLGGLAPVGLISYPLYLWHWPIIALTKYVSVPAYTPFFAITVVFTSVAFSMISYRVVEQPVRFGGDKVEFFHRGVVWFLHG